MSGLFDVRTERFGVVLRADENIAAARHWAREALGIHNPRLVTVHTSWRPCEACDSRPCVCAESA